MKREKTIKKYYFTYIYLGSNDEYTSTYGVPLNLEEIHTGMQAVVDGFRTVSGLQTGSSDDGREKSNLRAAVYGNISIMYPMIISTEKVLKIYDIVKELES